jgi:hypothetical protein
MPQYVQIITLPPVNTDDEVASYVASSRAECRDDTDRSAFDMALLTGQQVTCGKVIARPFRPVRRSFEEVREAFRTGDASTEELAAAASADGYYYAGDPHSARVYAAMLEIDRDDASVEWTNTGGNMMCLETRLPNGAGDPIVPPTGRRVLVGEQSAAPDGFGWCVDNDADGEAGGVNYEITIDTSNWDTSQMVAALTAILANPTPDPLALDLTGAGDFANVTASEY